MSALANGSRITPFLWFNDNAEEAVNFYMSIFKNSKILDVKRYGEAGPGPKGSVMVIAFELDGQEFTALNGGPHFQFTEAVSFVVKCEDQAEIDFYWDALTAGGGEVQCGWLKDKFGLSWQVVPKNIGELIGTPAAMQAMMTMKKLDIATLKRAASH
jgi:predicted 3-demethylubiquinone-9 3-methyltransferase (glyoxalase superfamily)